VVKTVISDSNILEEILLKKQVSNVQTKTGPASLLQTEPICQQKDDTKFIEALSNEVCQKILNNETFKQVVCDSISYELKEEINNLKNEKINLENLIEEQELYSRRNYLFIHGLASEENEDTDEKIIKFFSENLEINVTKNDIDRFHRLGKIPPTWKNSGPIIVKLIRHNLKVKICSKRKFLKGTDMLVTESLTKRRIAAIKKMKLLHANKKVASYWTVGGRIFYTLPNNLNKKLHLSFLNNDNIVFN